ncbi:MAG: tRNA threonylcarbamoyladenosine dehydratase [Mobilitalea sp.]
MPNQFSRTERLLGHTAMEKLQNARVAIFGIGGVGGYVVEALARSGVGSIDLIDDDKVCLSNLNRQIIATMDTIGRYKVDVMKERILSINPEAIVKTYQCFFSAETADQFDFSEYDYVVDAIDTVSAKIELILRSQEKQTPIISCMGAGNKLDPTRFEIADIYKTSVCPLAKVMRKELKARGVKKLKVLYSQELPLHPLPDNIEMSEDDEIAIQAERVLDTPELDPRTGQAVERKGSPKRQTPGSISFVPPAAGLVIAGEVIRDLSGIV